MCIMYTLLIKCSLKDVGVVTYTIIPFYQVLQDNGTALYPNKRVQQQKMRTRHIQILGLHRSKGGTTT